VTYVEAQVNADADELFIPGRGQFSLDPTWAFFILETKQTYYVDNWDHDKQCGCNPQVCGKECKDEGFGCFTHNVNDISWMCRTLFKENYCWSLVSSGKQAFSAYTLKHLSTIALTSYGGPDGQFVSPGFTISDRLAGQTYSLNALILNTTARSNAKLSDFRFVENQWEVIGAEEFANINTPPLLKADEANAKCTDKLDMKVTLDPCYRKKYPNPFQTYQILTKAAKTTITLLNQRKILTPNGILEWSSNERAFTYIDPCNQQFLTLQTDIMGNYYVKTPGNQRLIDGTICIAVQEDTTSSHYNLVLYEAKNATGYWTYSKRFVGILSDNYISNVALRITTDVSRPLIQAELHVEIKFNTDINPPFLTVTTSLPTSCKLFLSPNCTKDVFTIQGFLYKTINIDSCGYLYEKAAYDCQGFSASFYPPTNLVQPAFVEYLEEVVPIEVFSVPVAEDEPNDFENPFGGIDRYNFLSKFFMFLILAAVITSFTATAYYLYKMIKKKKSSPPKDQDHVKFTTEEGVSINSFA